MTSEINRPNVQAQPHAVRDIFGRLEKNLKHGERLQFMKDEELAFLKERFANNHFEILYAPQSEWPQGYKHLHVYHVHVPVQDTLSGLKRVPGVLLTFGKYSANCGPFAVVDCGEYGVIHRSVNGLEPMTKEEAEEAMPLCIRHGRRIIRAMRDIGSVPGKEDVTLLSIAQNIVLNRRFIHFIQSKTGTMGEEGFDSESVSIRVLENASDFALEVTRVLEMPSRTLVGQRCVEILVGMGINPGNLYHGMHEMLREAIRLRKLVERVDPHLNIRYQEAQDVRKRSQAARLKTYPFGHPGHLDQLVEELKDEPKVSDEYQKYRDSLRSNY